MKDKNSISSDGTENYEDDYSYDEQSNGVEDVPNNDDNIEYYTENDEDDYDEYDQDYDDGEYDEYDDYEDSEEFNGDNDDEEIDNNNEDNNQINESIDSTQNSNGIFSLFKFKHKDESENTIFQKRRGKKTPLYYIWVFIKKLVSLVVTTLISIFLILVITGTVCMVAFVIYVLSFMDTTTDVNLTEYEMSYASYIYTVDSDGNEDLVYKVKASNGEQCIPITIDQIPQDVRNAFVYTEDERFYSHDGVDIKRTLGAFVNIFTGIYSSQQGGSTITQQLVKNVTGDDETSSERKIREIFRAMQLEKKYPKNTILESYLNCIYFGRVDNNNLNGIEAAAIAYFGKSTSDLSIAEAACLAAIPKDPSNYNPLTNPENNKDRQEYVLSKMYENGVISPEQYEEALEEELVFTNSEKFKELYPDFKLFDDEDEEEVEYDEDGNPINEITPYYVDAAIYEVRDWIAEEEGISKDDALSKFNNGGYTLYLTIDLEMQAYVDAKYLDRSNFITYAKNPQGEYVQSSFIAMDYDGNVLAMAGGIGEKETNLGFNRAVQAQRQVGSTMKPVAAYGAALYNDEITWSTIFTDKGITVDGESWPKNYTTSGSSLNWSYNSVYVYDALRRSLNTTPANIVNNLGLETVFDYSKNVLGLNLVDPEDADNGVGDMTYSALAVGGLYGGTSIEDLVNAYMPYGNGGYFEEAHVISRIENSATGEILLDNTVGKEQVIDEETAYVMNKLLRQVITSGTGTAANLSNKTVCGKTGTTSDFNDITFVGLTEDFVSGIWVGYDTPYSLPASLSSAQIWMNVIGGYANSIDSDASYPECDSVVVSHFCTSTGYLATSRCPQSSEVGYYKSSNAIYCGRH